METAVRHGRFATGREWSTRGRQPAYQSYEILHIGFTVLPIVAGLDKLFYALVSWERYLAPSIARMLPLGVHTFMMIVGVVEMIAGVVVAVKPKVGGYVVAAWLLAIVVNLLIAGRYYDIALRDFGLALAAIALARLSREYSRR
jgi:hypothetical protein